MARYVLGSNASFPYGYIILTPLSTDSIANYTTAAENETVNQTSEEAKLGLMESCFLGIALSTLCFLTTVGNAMVLYAVKTERRLQTVSNMFIVSLAVSDLVVGAIVMPISTLYIFTVDWIFGVAACQFWIAVDYTASTASILNLFILSLDRYWSVRTPLRYIRKRTKSRARRMIFLVWFVSSLWIIPVVGWHYFVHDGMRYVPSNVCDTEYAANLTFKIITAIFNFYLPLAIMFALYGKVFVEIRKRASMEIGKVTRGKTSDSMRSTTLTLSPAVDDSDQRNTFYDYEGVPLNADKTGENATNNTRALLEEHYSPTDVTKSLKRVSSNELTYDDTILNPHTEKTERVIYTHHINLNSLGKSDKTNTVTCLHSERNTNAKDMRDKKLDMRGKRQNTFLNFSLKGISSGSLRETTNVDQDLSSGAKRSNKHNFIKATASLKKRSVQLSNEIKAARQLGVIMGAFSLCFLPYFVLFLYVGFCDNCIGSNVMLAVTWIGYLNSTLNPFIYPLCNTNFRDKFRAMLRCSYACRRYEAPSQRSKVQ